jgi:signal transduction histidine kinase
MKVLSIQDKTDLLKNIVIFSESEPDILSSLAMAMTEVEVLKGASIVKKGDTGDAMFIIAEGSVRVHDGNHVLARMKEGDFFGEYALIDDDTRSASVTAEEPCSLLKLAKNDFYQIALHNTDILQAVLRALIGRMRDMNELEEKLSRSYLKIRKQKEQIEKQHENISRQKEILSQQNYDLTKLNEEKNEMLSMVIHQIKNPLTSSLCLLEMLDSTGKDLTDDQDDALKIIINSLWRINNLINETLDVSSIESKVFEVKFEALGVHLIIQELIDNYTYLINQKEIELITQIDKVSAVLNQVYFTQIADNLFSNAFKFTPAGKKVRIILESNDDKVILTVEDEGPGISDEMKETLFVQYSRQTNMNTQGLPPTGLGLAIVNKYAQAMDGKVTCKDSPGGGTCFTVELPLDMSAD